LANRIKKILLFFLECLLACRAFVFLRGRETSGGANVRQFLDGAGIQRYRIKIIRTGERDAFFIAREMWVGLRVAGVG